MSDKTSKHLFNWKQRPVLGGKTAGVGAAFLYEGFVAVAEVESVIAAVELVPVQDGLQLGRVGPGERVERADTLLLVGLRQRGFT